MSSQNVNVDQWVEMLRTVGLSDDDMQRWHVVFEQRHPEGHQDFLEWLQLSETRITEIRKNAASGA